MHVNLWFSVKLHSSSSIMSLPKTPILSELWPRKFSNSISMLNLPQHHSNNMLINGASVASNIRIAYQGVPGAYGEAAAMKVYPKCETLQCEQFNDAMEAVGRGWAEEAIIPIQNSIGGSVHTNYDLLLRHHTLHLVGETHLFIHHCLLALPGVSKHHLNTVFSHPQALAQCGTSLKTLGVATRAADNTAVAAQAVASLGVKEVGAIASARAAKLYGLHIIAHKFQDRSNNVTRFLRLARKSIVPTIDTRSKTSIVFTPNEGPQGLHKALSMFASMGIHLFKIESRPLEKHSTMNFNGCKNGSRDTYFRYVYFIDFEASIMEPRVQHALERLQELASYFRILGCYPMDTVTW